ncbi:hypothetical protein Hanom_Chr14g01264671 [Helianthus anomalus]
MTFGVGLESLATNFLFLGGPTVLRRVKIPWALPKCGYVGRNEGRGSTSTRSLLLDGSTIGSFPARLLMSRVSTTGISATGSVSLGSSSSDSSIHPAPSTGVQTLANPECEGGGGGGEVSEAVANSNSSSEGIVIACDSDGICNIILSVLYK